MLPWFSLLAIHFGITYAILSAYDVPTKEMDEMLLIARALYDEYLYPYIERIKLDGNPFPRRSNAAKVYNFLFKG